MITTANQKKVKITTLSKARENAGDQSVIGLLFNLIGRESGISFLDQSQSQLKQNQFNLGFLSIRAGAARFKNEKR